MCCYRCSVCNQPVPATHAEITIKHSMTDQYRDGAVVLVSRSDIGTISEHVGCSVATQAISFPKHHENITKHDRESN